MHGMSGVALDPPLSTTDATPPPAPRRRRRRRAAIGAVAIAAVGLAVGAARRGDGRIDQQGYAPAVQLTGVEAGSAVALDGETPLPAPAASPSEAVERFLGAEIDGRWADSYAQLDGASRARVGGATAWDETAGERPTHRSFTITDAGDDTGTVVVEVVSEAQVSEVGGVVAGSSTISFATSTEDGGRRISLAGTVVEPHFPSPDGARTAALAWVTAAQRCEPAGASAYGEYEGSLLGTFGLAESLCSVAGSATVAADGGFDRLADPSALLGQFGSGAASWARVVTVGGLASSPVELILAPFGDRWVVVGAAVGE